jgi:hypothetical protein
MMAYKAYHTCDHCGKILDETKDWIGVEIDEFYPYSHRFDLCKACAQELDKIISTFINEPPKEE